MEDEDLNTENADAWLFKEPACEKLSWANQKDIEDNTLGEEI